MERSCQTFDQHKKIRLKVLEQHQINAKDAWGEGVLIFAPICKTGLFNGIKNRLLPMIDETPLSNFDIIHKYDEWSKQDVNKKISEGVKSWISYKWTTNIREEELRVLSSYVSKIRPGNIFTFEFLMEHIFQGPQHNKRKIAEMLSIAAQYNIIEAGRLPPTPKRLRYWKVLDSAILPWLHDKEYLEHKQ